MKKLVLVALFSVLSAAAHATADTTFDKAVLPPAPAQLVTIVKSSETVVGLDISTFTATSVVVDTTQMFRWVEVENLDASNYIVCGENSANISTGTVASLATAVGWVIPKSSTSSLIMSTKKFDIVPGRDFFCKSGSTSAATHAAVYRGR